MTPYEQNVQRGKEFEDYVTIQLHKMGLSVNAFSSMKYQYELGSPCSAFTKRNTNQLTLKGTYR